MMYEDSARFHRSGAAPLLRLLALGALGALLAGSWHRVAQTRQRRRHAQPAPLPHRLQTWEGEGGRPDPAHASSTAADPAELARNAAP